jgi:Na+-translocating ferredoxin:NAD+ oxidoreductase RnfA subunit
MGRVLGIALGLLSATCLVLALAKLASSGRGDEDWSATMFVSGVVFAVGIAFGLMAMWLLRRTRRPV